MSGPRRSLSTVRERCSYYPGSLPVSNTRLSSLHTAESILARLVSQTPVAVQTERKFRIARDRSRQKRGPPAVYRLVIAP